MHRSEIDPAIQGLVECLNRHGFITYASCQGHGFPADRRLPYVAFVSQVERVGALARYLREDAESASPRLHWGWEITGSFNHKFVLCYRLHPTGPHHWYVRYDRTSLRHDFSRISALIDAVNFGDFYRTRESGVVILADHTLSERMKAQVTGRGTQERAS